MHARNIEKESSIPLFTVPCIVLKLRFDATCALSYGTGQLSGRVNMTVVAAKQQMSPLSICTRVLILVEVS